MPKPQPIPRRSHKKSRAGCKNCKERRVKCDETKPICRKCAVHYDNITECDYGQFDLSKTEPVGEMDSMPESWTSKQQRKQRTEASQSRSLQIRRVRSISPSLLDPFKSHPECREPGQDVLMKTFFSRHIYNIFPYYPTPKLNPVIEYFAPIICKDALLMHVSMLCVALQQERSAAPEDRQQSRRLNAECHRLLQERINAESPECVSDTTLSAIAALTNIENYKGNIRHVQTHLNGLKRILDIRGGLDAVRTSHATIANMVFCAFIAAADDNFPTVDMHRPVTRPSWFWNAVQCDTEDPPIDLQAHGVDSEYVDIMLNLRMLAKTYQTAEDCKSTREYQDVLTFLTSTLQRLLSLPLPGPPVTYQGRITTACRHALLVHVFAEWCGHNPDPHLMVSMAQHALIRTLRPLMEDRVSNQLLLWLLSVGGSVRSGEPERKWFAGQLADVTEDLAISNWEDMRSKLKQVIWHDLQDEEQHRKLWDEVDSRRKEEQGLQVADVDV